MSKAINVIPAKVTAIENLSNDVYVSTSNDGVASIKVTHVNKSGSSTIDFQKGGLITGGNNNEIRWEIQCLQNSVLSTTNSGLKYTMQFAIKLAYKGFGRYYWKNGFVYFQKATFTKTTNIDSYTLAAPEVICTTAMNSAFPIYETTVIYNGEIKTPEVFRKSMFYQMFLPKDYQETMSQTWFEGDALLFDEFAIPFDEATGKYIEATTAANWDPANHVNRQLIKTSDDKFIWTFRKDFFIPLNMLNRVFNYSNNFYTNTIKKQSLYIDVRTQISKLANCFGSSEVFDDELTGIGIIDLQVVTKTSNVVQNDVAQKSNTIALNGIGVECRGLTAMFTDQIQINDINSKHASIARTALCLELKDQNDKDSTYLHQRFTGMTAANMLKYKNQQLLAEQSKAILVANFPLHTQDFVFFGNFNIHRGGDDNRLYSSDFQDLQSIRNEIIRSTNMSQQADRGLAPAFSNTFEWLSKYAFTFNSLEQYSMDECTNDIVGDGFNSTGSQSIFYKYNLVEYRNGFRANQVECKTDLTDNTKLRQWNNDANRIRITAYAFYDNLLIYDINNGQIDIKDFQ
ncbi:Conserved_hypothetical protein [Hexamita inflata]|uniref:Uncharacterized protein n=1 Tax=Hexamita inflata TaxID=28002 RepID=A0AA86QZY7_9EUKA|nr:Conserved hypothetical protein [Hexamita inflata]CAI9963108.1 Conserved hypothetical protein [Hexamita inflata]